MPEEISQITIISDLLKRDPAYKEVVSQLEERLYNRYMVYLSDKPRFNAKTQAIPKPYLAQILSFKNTLELNKIAKKYGLSQEQRDGILIILWKIFYHEAEIKNLPQMLNSELGINNIRAAYLMATDIANLYMPISDYLGDIPAVIKRWQYELPAESAISYQRPVASQQPIQPPPIRQLADEPTLIPIPPPIRPSNQSESGIMNQELKIPQEMPEDKPIPKVTEILSRLSQTRQAPIKSELEPEYLPDEPQKPLSLPQQNNSAHPANVIDLKNFNN